MAAAGKPSGTAAGPRLAGVLTVVRSRASVEFHDRSQRVRANLVLALQAGLAAALAWFISYRVIGHELPIFAPISAVVILSASIGQRLKRTAELVVGVAIGIAVGDAIVIAIGTGTWQLALIVPLAVIAAVFLGGGSALVTQAASSGVLVATLLPTTQSFYPDRFIDALVGGLVGLVVLVLLLPLNPLTVVRRAADPALDVLADMLIRSGRALIQGNRRKAESAARRLLEAEKELSAFRDAVQAGHETAVLAPARWRARGPLAQYAESAEYVTRGLRNSRVLTRRVASVLAENEPVPPALPEAICRLGEAVRVLRQELDAGTEPLHTRRRALEAAHGAGTAYEAGVGFNGSVVVAQIRAAASDLVRASGADADEVDRLVSDAFGKRDAG
ncbi:FUSC family protein [Solwaraspora sp. WMMD406]|uniref:FUSC family protein n=1 Tax=Solwaraspora sp. WMMD406 TaxID=3016095 RepID=UPI002415AE22|nr:FUSC family protein [Solwaraspora sp. WMMD406]MDG4768270.1 FUSC family protein [Solwaraspora sp. WMMD406]